MMDAGVIDAKAEKFKRLAEQRVSKIGRLLEQLGKLANRQNYRYTSEQAAKIIDELGRKLDAVEILFEPQATDKPVREKYSFSLND